MKTWLAGFLAVLVMAVGMPTMATGSSLVISEGDVSSTTYAVGDFTAIKVDSILEKITRLKNEIGKGTSVYSAEELRIFEQKLIDTREQLSVLTHGG